MDTKGEYRPRFYDVQTFLTFTLNEKWSIEFLGNVANNQYLVIPANRETTFGTVNNAVKLKIYFDGQELMQYNTMMGGLSTTYKPNSRTKLKLITSFSTSISWCLQVFLQNFKYSSLDKAALLLTFKSIYLFVQLVESFLYYSYNTVG